MRVFNWRELLTRHRVDFIERGANVKRGELNIKCPFCGSADPSHHMGLNLDTGWWACWRNSTHRGKSPLRLLIKLLNVPYWKARELAGLDTADYVDPEGFDAVAARIMRRESLERPEQVQRAFLQYDKTFKSIAYEASTRRAWEYLRSREFRERDIDALCEQYKLMTANTGRWANRVVIPYYLDSELVSWTGRAIGEAMIRYKDLSPAESLMPIKDMLFNYDAIMNGGEALVIVEGPIDVLKLDFYGRAYGVRSVGLSTNSMSDEQMFMLESAVGRFKRVVVMLDTETVFGIVDSMRLKQDISFVDDSIRIIPVPYGLKDAGAMSARQASSWTEKLARGTV